jgi:hypothetical protein
MKDFFISYNIADRGWAEWIAWQLEESGYTTFIQVWDFGAGSNFVLEMHRALTAAQRTIAVISPNFLKSDFCAPEWAAAFVQDPMGRNRKLLPVRVRECEPAGLLAALDYIDLVRKDATAARKELLSRISAALKLEKGESAKPSSAPEFPGVWEETRLPQPRFPGALPPTWNVPFPRNLNFSGRENYLKELLDRLAENPNVPKPQALTGLGGIGKTQLAVEYAYRNAITYTVVWWIRAEQSEVLASDYAALIHELKLPEREATEQSKQIDAVRRWLRANKQWLLVFDNAVAPKNVMQYLSGGRGHVLITSRNPNWSDIAELVGVKQWQPAESVGYLLNRTGSTDHSAAEIVSKQLGYLPLALAQASGYIEQSGKSVAAYSSLYETKHQGVLKRGQLTEYPDTVATTWELAMQTVEKESPGAAALLDLCSYFAPENIDRTYLVARVIRTEGTVFSA